MNIEIRNRQATKHFSAEACETLLEAALRAGIDVPYGCCVGSCGLCKVRLKTGQVKRQWLEAPGNGAQPKPNDVLLCQCSARSDLTLDLPGLWSGINSGIPRPERKTGIVTGRKLIGDDLLMIDIKLIQPVEHLPGQFILVRFPGIDGSRAFSFANPPSAPYDRISLIVKRKPDGKGSAILFEGNADGLQLEIFGPVGRATFDAARDGDLLCVAGGSGLSMALSIFGAAVACGHFQRYRGTLILGLRRPSDLYNLDLISALASTAGAGLRITVALSDDDPQPSPGWAPSSIEVEAGHAHEVAKRRMAGAYAGLVSFVAGPPPMVQVMQRLLITEGGLPGSNIRCDTFF
ncbi:MAG: 2Fe-2S iron-sulfur cluster-binding protein [Bradyrhizobium sp.]